ncbi:hypothetical protein HNV10_11240 [Winogradskyella litoriviva]|uniref:DUF4377 domain-containing protein n=1 Tax=Winogradskyella litoriviva TaxID=1220182 RepID=A0ABX2E5P8_9FLAO|nr:hypothetical protein [Winogradskyella litoriviva]NRD23821.1 hypothetical protein [Winogradskyella litoriviva]
MKSLKYLLLSVCFLCFNCDDIVDCIINKRPEIPDKSFDVGNIGYYYSEALTSEIKNEPNDDYYDYFYDIRGHLPDGLELYSDFRTVSIKGFPEVSGSFTFTIQLYVDPPQYYDQDSQEWEDNLCSYSTSKEFTIIIN